ncbi:germin-like protein 9-3 [Cryptomeria japonica]|uniref:germin-like protein 9-3 n=1 Tax=Cryptomeria japonica TaxID=3369 RepID=UPI0027DA83F4|nr:germin-like protein 9-3 [Cryptomeria japonica]
MLEAILVVFSSVGLIYASDPDILTDFTILVWQFSNLTGSYFTFKGFRDVGTNNLTGPVKVTKAVAAEFPALNGLGVSMAMLQFPVGGVNPPHTHPRASELLYLVDGSLLVGMVDTTAKLFTQNLTKGDLFVFPKGLLHYQLNADATYKALVVSAFRSANAGTMSVPSTLFTTGIPDDVLAKSFKTNTQAIELLKSGLKST